MFFSYKNFASDLQLSVLNSVDNKSWPLVKRYVFRNEQRAAHSNTGEMSLAPLTTNIEKF